MRAARTPHAMASKASGEEQCGSETLVAKSKQQNVKNEYSLSRGTEHRAAYRAPQWQQAQLAAARCAASRLRTMDRGSSWGAPARERACEQRFPIESPPSAAENRSNAPAAPPRKPSSSAYTDGEHCLLAPRSCPPDAAQSLTRCHLPVLVHHFDIRGHPARPGRPWLAGRPVPPGEAPRRRTPSISVADA